MDYIIQAASKRFSNDAPGTPTEKWWPVFEFVFVVKTEHIPHLGDIAAKAIALKCIGVQKVTKHRHTAL